MPIISYNDCDVYCLTKKAVKRLVEHCKQNNGYHVMYFGGDEIIIERRVYPFNTITVFFSLTEEPAGTIRPQVRYNVRFIETFDDANLPNIDSTEETLNVLLSVRLLINNFLRLPNE